MRTRAWMPASEHTVKARIAHLALADAPPLTIGEISLLPHQRHALARVRAAIREFHGALLADEVGLGKTYVALALAQDYSHTHVIAPAALLPMWRNAIARSQATTVTLHSMQRFSRTPQPAQTRPAEDVVRGNTELTTARPDLVIIDEAHHLRTRTTQRYRAVADFVAGRDVLLLSATPIHNRTQELRQLLALFAGQRSDIISTPMLARLIVRHTAQELDAQADAQSDGSSGARRTTPPHVREHPPQLVHTERAILDAILSLPSPLPARDGTVAGALIRLGLLRAWCSSDTALAHTLTRRLLRGEALRQALAAGRHPTTAELRTWLVGEHEVQLAFPELLAQESTHADTLLDDLQRHLDAVRELLQQLRRLGKPTPADAARAAALRTIIQRHPDVPVVAFSQFTRTVQSLYRALSDIAGVGALTGMHAQIASGRIARLDAISRFAPSAQGRPPPPTHQAIRILLTTDLLAEGVNLQDAGVIVHLDLPWTDALRRQRVGRLARLGSPHTVVHAYRLLAPRADHALQLTQRLLRKARLARRLVGTRRPTPQLSPADAATRVAHLLKHWLPERVPTPSPHSVTTTRPLSHNTHTSSELERQHEQQSNPQNNPQNNAQNHTRNDTRNELPIVARQSSVRRGWIAAVRVHSSTHIVVHDGQRVSANPRRVWQVLHDVAATTSTSASHSTSATSANATTATPAPLSRAAQRALRQLDRWIARRALGRTLGAGIRQLAPVQRLALTEISATVASAPALQRHHLITAARDAERLVHAARAIGAQQALAQWLQGRPPAGAVGHADPLEWLQAWRASELLRATHEAAGTRSPGPPAPGERVDTGVSIDAILLLDPPEGDE